MPTGGRARVGQLGGGGGSNYRLMRGLKGGESEFWGNTYAQYNVRVGSRGSFIAPFIFMCTRRSFTNNPSVTRNTRIFPGRARWYPHHPTRMKKMLRMG